MKAIEVAPAKLTRSLSAFANADGGELIVGVDEQSDSFEWRGFTNEEAANGHIQAFENTFPLGQGTTYEFLKCTGRAGLILRITIQKTRDVKKASNGKVYLRRGAQNLPVQTTEALRNLERAKGISSFEDETVNADPTTVTNSEGVISFMLEVVPNAEPDKWLRKQQLVLDDKPTVAALVLFADEPQVFLPKAAVKLYRYKTADTEGSREHLAFDPVTIEGALYGLIQSAVSQTVGHAEKIQIMTDGGLRPIQYPRESLHEIITNAVLHRDYALNDDVHVRIFDNRVEVESPGRLPAHITTQNILDERFARNPKLVRLINKFPNPPNKDVGEGLNTAFRAMKKLRLRDPQIVERDNSVLVVIRHEKLASPEQQIVDYARNHGTVTNSAARQATGIESEITIRALFKKLIKAGEIEQVPGTARATTAYRIPQGKR